MKLEQKVDTVLRYLKLRYELNDIIEQKNQAVKVQDFKQAVILREQEMAKAQEYNDNAKILVALLNEEQEDKRSVATESDSSTSG
jgi:hypothetical protein